MKRTPVRFTCGYDSHRAFLRPTGEPWMRDKSWNGLLVCAVFREVYIVLIAAKKSGSILSADSSKLYYYNLDFLVVLFFCRHPRRDTRPHGVDPRGRAGRPRERPQRQRASHECRGKRGCRGKSSAATNKTQMIMARTTEPKRGRQLYLRDSTDSSASL